MPEYSGSLQSFELAVALWLAPLLPLVAAIYSGIGGYIGGGDDSQLPKSFRPRFVALLAGLSALGLIGFHLVVLLGLPGDQRQLVSHAWGMQRIGSLDTSFTFSAEPSTLCLALALCLAAVVGVVLAGREPAEHERRLSAGVGLALSGGLCLVLGDDLVLVAAGSVLSGVGALLLASAGGAARAARGFVLSRIGDAALVGAAAALLWGLSGSWTGDGDYVPDFRARLVAVQVGDVPPPTADKERGRAVKDAYGSISMAALPGATLLIGGAELCASDADGKRGGVGTSGRPCREVARSPFSRLPLPVALHDIEVRTGPGTHDLLVEKTRIGTGLETLITVAGATTVVREMRDQLAIRDGSGAFPLRAALTKRQLLGQPLLGLVAGLLSLFVLLRALSAAFALTQRAAAGSGAVALAVLGGGMELCAGVAVLARLDFLMAFVPGTSTGLALVAALAALWAAARAAHGFDLRASLVLVAVANAGLCTAAAALGAHSAAVVGLSVTALAVLSLATAVAEDEDDLRELAGRWAGRRAPLLAALALAGAPLPGVGAFWARDGALAASASAGSSLGYAVLLVAAVSSGLLAFAVWRLVFLLVAGKASAKPAEPRFESAAQALALAALVVGALGYARAVIGEGAPSLLEGWLASTVAADSRGVPLERSVRLGVAALAFAAALVGFALARARYGASRDKDWAKAESSRVLAGQLGAPRELFDAVLLAPALAVGRLVQRFDGALELLLVGAPPAVLPATEPEPEEPEADEPVADAAKPKRKKKPKPEERS